MCAHGTFPYGEEVSCQRSDYPCVRSRKFSDSSWTAGLPTGLLRAASTIARSSVADYLRRSQEAGLTWPEVLGLSEAALEARDYLPATATAAQTQFAMDLARYAMTQTAEKVAGPTEVGDGFVNVWTAYEYAAKTLKDNAPGKILPKVRSFLRGLLGFAPA